MPAGAPLMPLTKSSLNPLIALLAPESNITENAPMRPRGLYNCPPNDALYAAGERETKNQTPLSTRMSSQ